MTKRYFVYWSAKEYDGNIIVFFDFDKDRLEDFIRHIIGQINTQAEKEGQIKISDLAVKFITELK